MQGLPLDGTSIGVTALYAIVLFLMGLCIAAAAPACNNPIFAEIVPPELRNMVRQPIYTSFPWLEESQGFTGCEVCRSLILGPTSSAQQCCELVHGQSDDCALHEFASVQLMRSSSDQILELGCADLCI